MANTTTLTYVGGGGARILGTADGFNADMHFVRGVPLEVDPQDAKWLLEHASGEFAEGEVDSERLGVPFTEAGPTGGTTTDTTGDVPGPEEPEPPAMPADDKKAAKSAGKD